MTSRRVVFAVFPDFQILDLTGPLEVFAQAAGRLCGAGYVLDQVAALPGPVRATCGLSVSPTTTTDESLAAGPVDTLVAVGGPGVRAACGDREFVGWFRETAAGARRVASVCSGAFLLARAELLDGRRAVTHWSACGELARRYPLVRVDPDPIFVRDGRVWTSAGVTAGIDLALALAEDDHGPELARVIARQLVMFVQRPGGQAQFSAQLAAQRPVRAPLREVQEWIAEHPDRDLSVAALAGRAGMSERNFARVFRAETGSTPAVYVEAARVQAARRLLETTDTPVDGVARASGFGSPETLHRSFRRTVRVTPGEYRRRFSSVAAMASG